MRKLKRLYKHLCIYMANKDAIHSSHQKLREYFGTDIEIRLMSFGGEDLNYTLKRNKKTFAIFRQCISVNTQTHLNSRCPIQRQNRDLRIQKETFAYTQGGEHGLTPKLLYSFEHGVVCEYIQGDRLWHTLKKDPQKIWHILDEVIKIYSLLHNLGIAHLDATLKNAILDNNDQKIKIFDFEYYAHEDMSFELQKSYDIIRLIEHSLRNVPLEYQHGFKNLIEQLEKIISKEMRHLEFSLVSPYLQGIKKYPIYEALKQKIFFNL